MTPRLGETWLIYETIWVTVEVISRKDVDKPRYDAADIPVRVLSRQTDEDAYAGWCGFVPRYQFMAPIQTPARR